MGRNGKNGKLNKKQQQFMQALESVIERTCSPASVFDLRAETGKSDGRIRSHLKRLIQTEYVCRIGKNRSHRYVPSILWAKRYNGKKELALMGGYCQTPGCENLAVEYFRGGYWCRECLIGRNDREYIRRQHEERIARKSCAGELVDCIY